MYDFSIDRRGDDGNEDDDTKSLTQSNKNDEKEREINGEKILNRFHELPELSEKTKIQKKKENDFNSTDTYLITNYKNEEGKKKVLSLSVDNILAKSSITPGFEKEHAIPLLSKRMLKLNRKKLREKTKGEGWYNLPATEVTDEVKNDLQILKMRSVLNKNHFYKKNDLKNISKYFQFGTVVETAADFYSGRIVKSKRKKTIVDELLADAECKNYQKKKYKEIMDASRRRRSSHTHKQKLHTKNKKSTKT